MPDPVERKHPRADHSRSHEFDFVSPSGEAGVKEYPMRRAAVFFGMLILAATALVSASNASAGSGMPVIGTASQPVGHYQFCRRNPAECAPNATRAIVGLTQATWEVLNAVNVTANTMIEPQTDEEIYGVTELWTYPGAKGDCEDYVLSKQRSLEKAGLPASALLITVVRQKDGSGHAVLTVRTTQGDYVLDNLDDRILPWEATEYTYLKRQSQADAGRWVTIEDSRDVLVGSVR